MSDLTLTDEEREQILDCMELPTKPQIFVAVARLLAKGRAEAWDQGWGAAKADLPDREQWIKHLVAHRREIAGSAWEFVDSEATADVILALIRGEQAP